MKYLVPLLFIFLLVACGGGSKKGAKASVTAETPKTVIPDGVGVFVGNISGVGYESASYSGFTNDRGEFFYEPGETVTFSVSGLTLGSAEGKARITPADFYTAELPATRDALAEELADRDVTDFDRTVNIMMLLTALDFDQNSGNGLNIWVIEPILEGIDVDFDVDLYRFPDTQLKKITQFYFTQVALNISPAKAASFLYTQSGINVPTYDTASLVWDIDGTVLDKIVYSPRHDPFGFNLTYNDKGYIEEEILLVNTRTDNDKPEKAIKTNYQFHSNNRVSEKVSWHDIGGDGFFEEERIETFSEDGLPLSIVIELDWDQNGTADSSENVEIDYEQNLRIDTHQFDRNKDGKIDQINVTTITYNAALQPLTEVHEKDVDADGDIDVFHIYERTFDGQGNLLTFAFSKANAMSEVHYLENLTITPDENGNPETETFAIFPDRQSVLTEKASYSHNFSRSFDNNSELESEAFQRDGDIRGGGADGKADFTFEYEYDMDVSGNLTVVYTQDGHEKEGGADGFMDEQVTEIYDISGRLKEKSVLADGSTIDGVFENSKTTAYQYSDRGDLLSTSYKEDIGMDGTVEQSWTETCVYEFEFDENKNIKVKTTSCDQKNPAGPLRVVTETYTYNLIENGMELMVERLAPEQSARNITYITGMINPYTATLSAFTGQDK